MIAYALLPDLAEDVEAPADGIVSRTIFQDDRTKAMLFGFGRGKEPSEHTAAKSPIVFFVQGEVSVGLGVDGQEARAGTWGRLPAN